MLRTRILLKQLGLLLSILLSFNVANSQNLYWIGGSGDWDDINHWSESPGNVGVGPAGYIPDKNHDVIIDDFSGLNNTATVRITTGSYTVKSIEVTSTRTFTLLFDGTSGNTVDLTIYNDLTLTTSMNLAYSSTNIQYNVWKFDGSNSHDISTGNNDLLYIEFLDENGTFNQLSNLKATEQIRMYAGTWNSNNLNINTGKLLFDDNEPSNAPLTKVFNSGTSNILCEEWESGFTYGSLTVTGNHIIYTSRFRGSPKQNSGPFFSFNEIHLLEYSDAPIGAPIEHNNFECRSCEIEKIIIEDTGETKFADQFTVNGDFIVTNLGSSILFNGGNSRTSEITFLGNITTPSVASCSDSRTIFSSVHTDLSTFIRPSGTLKVSDAIINSIHATGGATFNASNSVLQGASSGWTLINNPNPINYVWKGTAGVNRDWDEPNSWIDQSTGTSNGCIPTLVDNVLINNSSLGNIRIPSPFLAQCNNLLWTNSNGLELRMAGTSNEESGLVISGDLELDNTATVSYTDRHEIYFNSTSKNTIETNGVALPDIWFLGDLGEWKLRDDLTCDRLTFEAGTLITGNNDIETDYWNSIDDNPKHFTFGSSVVTVNGELVLSRSPIDNVTVAPGTSLLICERLTSSVEVLYDVKLINTPDRIMDDYNYNFNRLILGGTGLVSTQNDLTLNDLVFEVNGSSLAIEETAQLIINGGIESQASAANPASLKSRTIGTRADIDKTSGNLCAQGPINFQDIDGVLSGIFSAPMGVDISNNNNINFDDGSSNTYLYWIGGSGDWEDQENWSKVSGGCPTTNAPNSASRLIFDDNGLFNPTETVLVLTNNTCNDMYFYNTLKEINLTINVALNSDVLIVSNGDLNITGTDLLVAGETRVESAGFLSTDLSNFTTKSLNTLSGTYEIKANSNATIKP